MCSFSEKIALFWVTADIVHVPFPVFIMLAGYFCKDPRRYMVVLHDNNNTVLHRQLDRIKNSRTVTETHSKRRGIVVARKNIVWNTRRGIDHVIFQSKYQITPTIKRIMFYIVLGRGKVYVYGITTSRTQCSNQGADSEQENGKGGG